MSEPSSNLRNRLAAGGLSTRGGRDGAIESALERIGGLPDAIDDPHRGAADAGRADTPDLRVTAVRRLQPTAAEWAPFPPALEPRLCEALTRRGISQLYTHQAEAIEHALHGHHVVVVTPT